MIDIDYTKKGLIVFGSARSGSHMACDHLYNLSTAINKVNAGELYTKQRAIGVTDSELSSQLTIFLESFVYCSIVQFWARNMLAMTPTKLSDYNIVNLRRRDKVAQYLSWCIFRAQGHNSVHTPDMSRSMTNLPWESSSADIELFIAEQHVEFLQIPNRIVYYEDLVAAGVNTKYTKNIYQIPANKIVTDYPLVTTILSKFDYGN